MGLTVPDEKVLREQQEQAMQREAENPFNIEQYRNMQQNDAPINYGGGMSEMLLSDASVPEPFRKKYWWVFNRDNVLTFLDEGRKSAKMMSFDIAMIDTMNSMGSFDDYTFATELQHGLIRNMLDVKLDRAVGFKGTGTKNERIVLQSQFSEARHINEAGDTDSVKSGFFKRLLGRR